MMTIPPTPCSPLPAPDSLPRCPLAAQFLRPPIVIPAYVWQAFIACYPDPAQWLVLALESVAQVQLPNPAFTPPMQSQPEKPPA